MARDRKARGKFAETGDGLVMEFGSKEGDEFKVKATKAFTFTGLGVPAELVKQLNEKHPILVKLAQHGLKQKVSDSFADPEADPATSAETVYNQLKSGEWTSKGDGVKAPPTYIQALAELHNVSVEDAQARYDAKSEADQKALRAHPKVKAKVAEITERKAKERKSALNKAAKDAGELAF